MNDIVEGKGIRHAKGHTVVFKQTVPIKANSTLRKSIVFLYTSLSSIQNGGKSNDQEFRKINCGLCS